MGRVRRSEFEAGLFGFGKVIISATLEVAMSK